MRFLWPALLLTVFFVMVRGRVFSWPYCYDEADYMYAVSLGWQANYADAPSQSLADFVRAGRRSSDRADLSHEIRSVGDVDFYRHWHGPLYSFWLLALKSLHYDETATRRTGYIFPVLTALGLYFGCLWLLPGSSGALAGMLASAFYLWSYPTVFTNEIAPHQLFVFCSMAAMLLVMKWRETRLDRYWFASVAASACAFCTLEVAFVLIAVLAVCAAPRLRDWKWIGKATLLWIATVSLLWPSALWKLSAAKAYLFLAYLALRRTSPWGDQSFFETWRLRFLESPWEWLIIAAALFLHFLAVSSTMRRLLFPVVLYGGLMLAVLLRINSETPRYLLPLLPALHLLAGFTFAAVVSQRRLILQAGVAVALCLIVLRNTASQIETHAIRPAPSLNAALEGVRRRGLADKKLLIPQRELPMIHYYFPAADLWGYANDDERAAIAKRTKFDAVLN